MNFFFKFAEFFIIYIIIKPLNILISSYHISRKATHENRLPYNFIK